MDSLQLFREPDCQQILLNLETPSQFLCNQMKQTKTSSWAIYLEPCNKSLGSALFNLCFSEMQILGNKGKFGTTAESNLK